MIMESIRDDLSRKENLVESKEWHRDALMETERLLTSDKLSVLDWNEAKKTLMKRRDLRRIKTALIPDMD